MNQRTVWILCSLAFLTGCAGLTDHRLQRPEAGNNVKIAVPTQDPYQAIFLVAVDALRRQDYATAVTLLEALHKETPSPRVTLELARACYLDRRYREARELFDSALDAPDLPWAVRENINRYLEEIDNVLGRIDYSVAFVSDSNPLNFTDQKQINILGDVHTIVAPPNNKETYGLQVRLNTARALTGDASASGYLNVDFRNYPGKSLDKWIFDGGLATAPRTLPHLRAKAGLEYALYGGTRQYRMPYLAVTYYPDPVNEFSFSSELKLGYLDVDDYDYLDAHLQTLDLRARRDLSGGSQLLGELYLENAITSESPYRYRGGGIGLEVSFPVYGNWGMTTSGAAGYRRYAAADPFFGERRRDLSKRASFSLFNRQWKWLGITPEVGVAYERVDSSIGYYSYDKWSVILRAASR